MLNDFEVGQSVICEGEPCEVIEVNHDARIMRIEFEGDGERRWVQMEDFYDC